MFTEFHNFDRNFIKKKEIAPKIVGLKIVKEILFEFLNSAADKAFDNCKMNE